VKDVPHKLTLLWLTAACTGVAAFFSPQAATAQSLITGYWWPLLDQDAYPYNFGPDPGDFSGLPITSAARAVAQAFDPERDTLPELQCRPFPATYGPRSVSTMRVWEVLDPQNQQQTRIETWISFSEQHRTIWMPASHVTSPPPWAPGSWQGFSTGRWVGNVLWVHTDHLKETYLETDGVPLDDETTMDERISRYGDVLLDVIMISDPQYLSQPLIYSKLYYSIPHGSMDGSPCTAFDEVKNPDGLVPMYLPFYTVGIDRHLSDTGIPLEAQQGGAQTMLPEYQDYMKTLPPNPPWSQLDRMEQKERAQQEAYNRAAGAGSE
jgi:hypothetical protein